MLKNNFKIALRNLLKFKGYAAINILGLVIGVTACLLTFRYINDELSYDQHHVDKENIYRVDAEVSLRNEGGRGGRSPSPLAFALQKDFPEIVESARICQVFDVDQFLIKYQNQSFFEDKVIFADSNLFELLTYEFIKGDKTTALDEPYAVVVSDKTASKLFGNENPIGQTIEISSNYGADNYQITGVFDSQKYQSHIDGDFYISARSGNIGKRFYRLQEWAGLNLFYTYVKLQPETDITALTAAFPNWLNGYAGERFREFGMQKRLYLTNIGDVYLRSEGENIFGEKGNITLVYMLMAIAVFILLIACINFMNLATAKSSLRSKEVGVRKVAGATRFMLIKQFMSEAFVYAFIAVLLAYLAAELLLPSFNYLTNKELTAGFFNDGQTLLWLVGFVLITTLMAGSYPALYLSAFSPANIFKNKSGGKDNSQKIRSALVVFQFVIAIGLILGVLVIQEQLDFMRNKSLGFNPEAKMVISLNTSDAYKNYPTLRNELLKNKQINEIGAASGYPGEPNGGTFFYYKEGQNPNEGFMCVNSTVTPEFMKVMDFELLTGRFFEANRWADTVTTAVITEKVMHGLGFTVDNVLGQQIFINFEAAEQPGFKVIGVIKDYIDLSLHEESQGQVFDWSPQWPTQYVLASVDTENLSQLLPQMEAVWQQFNPNEPFEFQFLEDRLQQNYLADQRMSQLILGATFLAIFISALGLLGLVTFAAERRRKEIGVRKILGASIQDIITLLSKDFIRLVLIALVIAAPISWYAMNQWLNDFAYRIDIQWWMIGLAGAFAIGITLITVGFQSVKAALSNPTESLRSE